MAIAHFALANMDGMVDIAKTEPTAMSRQNGEIVYFAAIGTAAILVTNSHSMERMYLTLMMNSSPTIWNYLSSNYCLTIHRRCPDVASPSVPIVAD